MNRVCGDYSGKIVRNTINSSVVKGTLLSKDRREYNYCFEGPRNPPFSSDFVNVIERLIYDK